MCDTRAPCSVIVYFQSVNQRGECETINTQTVRDRREREREREVQLQLKIHTDLHLDRLRVCICISAGPVNKRPNESIDEAVCAKQ